MVELGSKYPMCNLKPMFFLLHNFPTTVTVDDVFSPNVQLLGGSVCSGVQTPEPESSVTVDFGKVMQPL